MFSHEQYDALSAGAGFLDRSGRGRLRLTGTDRRAYLQGLLTNDIVRLTAGTGCYAALLTAQGRMTSDMRVSELGDAVLIDLPAATLETVRTRLADFIFTEDVEVHDATAVLGQVGVYGPNAATALAGILPEALPDLGARLSGLPLEANASGTWGDSPLVFVASDDYGVPGFDVFVEAARTSELMGALGAAGVEEVSPETVHVTRVEAGRPEFGLDMDEHTIPLEAGIEGRAISLTKGCYVGQEIIIRVLHRGHGRVARHLVGLVGESQGGSMEKGERIQREGREVGLVTSAAVSPRLGQPIALGYVHRDHVAPGTVLEIARQDDSSRTVTVSPLPFTPSTAG